MQMRWLGWLLLLVMPCLTHAACRDSVVLVHGNTGSPADFQNTYDALLDAGWNDAQIVAPSWGNPYCAACNDHNGSEETPVAQALQHTLADSCTGRIDVIGHSMGATLAAHEIDRLGIAAKVDVFLGIAGAFHGLYSCGTYPYNVANATCGAYGLSIHNPFLNALNGRRFGATMVSFKSYSDEINCYGGPCEVDGVHTSSIPGETASYDYPYGHYQLLWYTAADQVALLQR